MDDELNFGRWHAPHPYRTNNQPLCGTVSSRYGWPTHRVSVRLPTTCKRCLKLLKAAQVAAKEAA